MPTPILKPKRPRPSRRTHPADPYYGHGYNPAWPSILSVAHDPADGGRLFVITDRPCVLVSPPAPLTGLPLSVGGLSVVGAAEILPIRFRLQMSGAVPHGAAWAWAAGATGLLDPVTNHPPNPAAGACADTPGPYTPPAPLVLEAASYDENDAVLTLTFDRAVNVAGFAPGAAVTVKDGLLNGQVYHGASAVPAGPNAVAVVLAPVEPYGAEDVVLFATAGSGLAAADDGGAWAGTAGVDVVLPWP